MLHGIFTFIIDIVTGFFAGFLLLRFWMQVQRVRPPSSLAQAIFQITDWIVHPIRRIIPGFRGYDWATLTAVFLTALVPVLLDFWLLSQVSPGIILILTVFRVAQWALYGLMALLLIEAVFSWINPHAPLAPFVRALNEPLLAPFRRLLPSLGGLDFSPLLVLIILQVLSKVLNEALPRLLMTTY